MPYGDWAWWRRRARKHGSAWFVVDNATEEEMVEWSDLHDTGGTTHLQPPRKQFNKQALDAELKR